MFDQNLRFTQLVEDFAVEQFVAVKSVETQGRAVAFRTYQCLVRQRTQLINALRGHLAEFDLVAPKGLASLKVLEDALKDKANDLPFVVREMGTIYLDQIARIREVIERLADELETASKTDMELRRLCTIPGFGPVTAGAVAAVAFANKMARMIWALSVKKEDYRMA
ncbi:transposase [Roseibium sediminis]|uniref:transposase n=1 Tax=Roseibium sediminis TaxID=1775174 RepID=UPI001AD8FF8D|nr:transposase [Roseibium sediminis]